MNGRRVRIELSPDFCVEVEDAPALGYVTLYIPASQLPGQPHLLRIWLNKDQAGRLAQALIIAANGAN